MTEAGWTREPNFTEVARKLVLKINEIQPDQWDQYDDKDHARIMTALKTTYQQGRVAGLREAGDLHEQVNTYCDHEPKAGAGGMGVAIRYRDLIRQQATKLAQQAQGGV